MTKKITAMLLLICMLLSLLPAVGISASAMDTEESEETALSRSEEETTDLESVFKAELYIKADQAAGLNADVKVDFGELSCYGTLYLPGCADETQLFFSWDDEELKVVRDGTVYESGTAPAAADGETVSYIVSKGLANEIMTIKTVKGSEYVSAMFLELDESLGTIEAMNADPDHETSCYGGVLLDGEQYPYISMKGRGNSTWSKDKKPYNLTFYKKADYNKKQNVELIDGVKAKKWSLLANYLDASLLRNKVAMDLAVKLGIGLKSRFVDLWMNGEYLGSYLLCPKNDYKAPDGGYVLENDNYLSSDDPQFTLAGMKEFNNIEGYNNRMTVKDIGDDALEAGETAETIEAYFSEAWEALRDYDSDEYTKYFDVDSWAKMYLMYEMTKTYDVFSGSVLMHRDGLTEDDLIIAGPAWDYDVSTGRTLYKFLSGVTAATQLTAEGWYMDSAGLAAETDPVCMLQEFGKHPDFLRRMSDIFNEYKWAFDEMTDDIDTQRVLLASSAAMDSELWGVHHLNADFVPVELYLGTGSYQLNYKVTDSWAAYVDNMREYVTKRLAWLTDALYTEAPTGTISGNTSLMAYDTLELTAEVFTGTDENTYRWQSSKNGRNWDDIEGATEQTLKLQVTEADDGMQYRCLVSNSGSTIYMLHTEAVRAAARTAFESVKISVSAHSHAYTEKTAAPTCTEGGYTLHICSCGDNFTDSEKQPLSHEYVNGFCCRCGEKNPNVTTEIRREKTSLSEGRLIMSLNGREAGEFTFSKTEGGWCIQNGDGKYLAVERTSLVLSDSPFVWSFSANMFHAETRFSLTALGRRWGINRTATAYLYRSGEELTVSLVVGKIASFARDVEYLVG